MSNGTPAIRFQFTVLELDQKDKSGKSTDGTYLVLSKIKEDGKETKIWRSGVQTQSINPVWKAVSIPFITLFGTNDPGDDEWENPLELRVWDYDRVGSDDFIGETRLSADWMKYNAGGTLPITNAGEMSKATRRGSTYANSGLIKLVAFEVTTMEAAMGEKEGMAGAVDMQSSAPRGDDDVRTVITRRTTTSAFPSPAQSQQQLLEMQMRLQSQLGNATTMQSTGATQRERSTPSTDRGGVLYSSTSTTTNRTSSTAPSFSLAPKTFPVHPHVMTLADYVVRQVVGLAQGAAQHEVGVRTRQAVEDAERYASKELVRSTSDELNELERRVVLNLGRDVSIEVGKPAEVTARLAAQQRALAEARAEIVRLDGRVSSVRAQRVELECQVAAFRDAAPRERQELEVACRERRRIVKEALASLFQEELRVCVLRDEKAGVHEMRSELTQRFVHFEDESRERILRLDRIATACELNVAVLEQARTIITGGRRVVLGVGGVEGIDLAQQERDAAQYGGLSEKENPYEGARGYATNLEGFDEAVAQIRRAIHDPSELRGSLDALQRRVVGNPRAAAGAGDFGGVEAAVAALRTHIDDALVQESGCRLLLALLVSNGACSSISKRGETRICLYPVYEYTALFLFFIASHTFDSLPSPPAPQQL